jgi:hypothetical protein
VFALTAVLSPPVLQASAAVPALGELSAPADFANEVVARLDQMEGLPVEPASHGTTFADLQDDVAAVATAPTGTYVDPDTGNPWVLATLLERASGVEEWLAESAAPAAVESEIETVVGAMGWRLAAYPVMQGVAASANSDAPASGCTTDPANGQYQAEPGQVQEWQDLYHQAEAGPWDSTADTFLGAESDASGAGSTVTLGRGVINALLPEGSQAGSGMPPPSSSPLWQSGLPVPGVPVNGARVVLEAGAFGTGGSDPVVTPGGGRWDTGAGWIAVTGGAGVDSPSFAPDGSYANPQPISFGHHFPQRIRGESTGYILLDVPTSFLFKAGGNPLRPVFRPSALIQMKAEEPPPDWPSTRDLGTTCADNEEWNVGDVSDAARPAGLGGDPVLYHENFRPLTAPTTCGTKPASTLQPPSLAFRTHTLGRASDEQTFTVTNTGQPCSELFISDISEPFGPGTPHYHDVTVFYALGCYRRSLAAGRRCKVSVSVSAWKLGSYRGTLTLKEESARVKETLRLTIDALAFPGTPGSGTHLFNEADKIRLKGLDKSANAAGNTLALVAAVNAVLPDPVFTKGAAAAFVIGAGALKVIGSAAGYLAEVVDPTGDNYGQTPVAHPMAFPHATAGSGVPTALANAVNALTTNAVDLRANLVAFYTALDRASGALDARDASAVQAQEEAAGKFANAAAGEVDADPGLRSSLMAELGALKITLPTGAALRHAEQVLKHNGLPQSVTSILKSLGFTTADIVSITHQQLPRSVGLSSSGARQLLHDSNGVTEQTVAAVLRTVAKELVAP